MQCRHSCPLSQSWAVGAVPIVQVGTVVRSQSCVRVSEWMPLIVQVLYPSLQSTMSELLASSIQLSLQQTVLTLPPNDQGGSGGCLIQSERGRRDVVYYTTIVTHIREIIRGKFVIWQTLHLGRTLHKRNWFLCHKRQLTFYMFYVLDQAIIQIYIKYMSVHWGHF